MEDDSESVYSSESYAVSERPDKERRKQLKRAYKRQAASERERELRENPLLLNGLEPQRGGCLLSLLVLLGTVLGLTGFLMQ